jgi:peroxiredoxin
MRADDLYKLPANIPNPEDDGASVHLIGLTVPQVSLPSTSGGLVNLNAVATAFTVVYCYPRTGRPDANALGGTDLWNAIPGARGCTPQSCSYRDNYSELQSLGASIFGLSTQTTDYQREAVQRLHLPFPLLSDLDGNFSGPLRLPQFEVAGVRLLKRLTLVINRQGRILHCIYPVFPPDQDAGTVVAWLRSHAA